MIYLDSIQFPSQEAESGYFCRPIPTYYQSNYPFQVFPQKGMDKVHFSDITIFCGTNGSGKSTTLNVIAEKLNLNRDSRFNTTELYKDFVEMTKVQFGTHDWEEVNKVMATSRIITSDDVFNHILDVRQKNDDLEFKRNVILRKRAEYCDSANIPREINFDDPSSFRRYKDYADMTSKSFSGYVRSRGVINERTYSNGENGYRYFTDAIKENGIYLLDEPENSLSAQLQIELGEFILGMARFYGCQFIISSHSPFILSIPFARIYDMDAYPVRETRWTDVPSVRMYQDFFKQHEGEF